jgi:pimeloyl-ACP methyl ester carboxylesterase
MNFRFNSGKPVNNKYRDEFLKDLCQIEDYKSIGIEGFFFNKVDTKNIRKDKITQCICEFINNGVYDSRYIKRIHKYVDIIEERHSLNYRKHNLDISDRRLKWNRMPIKAWYIPLPFQLIKYGVRMYTDYKLEQLKFTRTDLDRGYTVWSNGYDKKKGKPIIIFHCSIGGTIFYSHILAKCANRYNIILPETPGISWRNYSDDPPLIYEMVNMLSKYLKSKPYTNVKRFNIVGHSFGCLIASSFINHHDDMVENAMIMEGAAFFPNTIKNYEDFDRDLWDYAEIPLNDLMTVPLFYRDLYTQYYFLRSMFLLENLLYGLTDFEKDPSRELCLIYSGADRKIDHKAQLAYVKMKNIPCSYKIFKNRSHGSFIFDRKFQTQIGKIFDKWTDTQIDNEIQLNDIKEKLMVSSMENKNIVVKKKVNLSKSS